MTVGELKKLLVDQPDDRVVVVGLHLNKREDSQWPSAVTIMVQEVVLRRAFGSQPGVDQVNWICIDCHEDNSELNEAVDNVATLWKYPR